MIFFNNQLFLLNTPRTYEIHKTQETAVNF